MPKFDWDDKTIIGYKSCSLIEGEFENGALTGFGRMIRSDGYYAIGLWRGGYLYGWAKQVQPDGF